MIQEANYIFWGTGRVARNFYKKYHENRGVLKKPLFWCDNNPALQGTFMDGVEVVSSKKVAELSEEFYRKSMPLAIVIGAAGINLLQIVSQLEQMEIKAKLYSSVQLDAAVYFGEEAEKVNLIYDMLEDDKSKQTYQSMVENMRLGRCVDFSLAEPNQYFGNDIIPILSSQEVFVDAGVCQGEEIDRALAMSPDISVHAFEPDTASFRRLQEKYQSFGNIALHPQALWHKHEYMSFSSNSLPSASRVTENERTAINRESSVECIPLDDALRGNRVSLLKMDIEGAEYNALQGAEGIIKEWHPKLAICIYHNLEDYVRIPLLLYSMVTGYRFFFRQHSVTSGESVLYAL